MRLFLYGKRAAGKSTVARFLAEMGARVYKLSDPLYRIAEELFGMKEKDRRLLQLLGDKLREIDRDCLLRYLSFRLYRDEPGFAVVEDVRLVREAEYLRRIGFLGVLVKAPEALRQARLKNRGEGALPEAESHPTEAEVELITPDFVVENSGSLKELRKNVAAVVAEAVYRGAVPAGRR
jgi:dephospho-CoA kinase